MRRSSSVRRPKCSGSGCCSGPACSTEEARQPACAPDAGCRKATPRRFRCGHRRQHRGEQRRARRHTRAAAHVARDGISALLGLIRGPRLWNYDPMREIVLDTETTGLNPQGGDRLIEIGCVELRQPHPHGARIPPLREPRARRAGRSRRRARAIGGFPEGQAAVLVRGRGVPRLHRRRRDSSSTTQPSTSASSTPSSHVSRVPSSPWSA